MMKRYLLILLFPLAMSANDSIISLQQCIDMALANNAAMQKADNNTEAARQQRREAFTKYFPEISAQGFGFRTHHYVLQYNLLNLLEVGMIKHGVLGGVQALQPIFMGGQIINGNKLAKVGEAVAELQQKQTASEVRVAAEKYYWELATLKATKLSLSKGIELLDTLQYQVGVAVRTGIVTSNELLKVDLQRNDFAAKMVDLDNGIKLCRMVLSQYVGAPFTSPVDIDAAVPDSVPPYPLDLRIDPAQALTETNNYKLLVEQLKAAKLEKRMEVGKNLPTVLGGAGWYYHDVLEQGHNYGALMLAINIPISGWWGGSHAIKRKDAAVKNAQIELEDLSEMIQINMQNKWDDLTAAHRKMEIASEAIVQSKENLRLNQAFYDAGTGTITDLLDAQTLNQQARDNYIAAYGCFRSAVAEYLSATGR
ncbi:MAG: TolC family protein [Bacteroides sp.]|nr:TolC family protein [Bacteroides sp.]MCM1379970.1 TolC family protein [Bacteroides sp.]MCM1446275.1 TolC family protein [Prevotella sp.]